MTLVKRVHLRLQVTGAGATKVFGDTTLKIPPGTFDGCTKPTKLTMSSVEFCVPTSTVGVNNDLQNNWGEYEIYIEAPGLQRNSFLTNANEAEAGNPTEFGEGNMFYRLTIPCTFWYQLPNDKYFIGVKQFWDPDIPTANFVGNDQLSYIKAGVRRRMKYKAEVTDPLHSIQVPAADTATNNASQLCFFDMFFNLYSEE